MYSRWRTLSKSFTLGYVAAKNIGKLKNDQIQKEKNTTLQSGKEGKRKQGLDQTL